MLIFFDTEFTDLHSDARLISIGLVSEQGGHLFYAELLDTYRLSDCGDFTRDEVLPLLEGGTVVMAMSELSARLATWLASFDEPVILATDSLAWDWPWIQKIFKAPGNWPANLDRKPLLLTAGTLVNFEQFEASVERAFIEGLRQHHALDDAKANRLGWMRLVANKLVRGLDIANP